MNGHEGTPTPPDPDQLVYALGQIGYDFPSGSRRASFQQRIDAEQDPEQAAVFLKHLDEHPQDATAAHWLLMLEGVPIYLLHPTGPFASDAYELLRRFLREQIEDGVERVSVPGVITDTARHRSGVELPVVAPVLRGMYSWTTEALVDAVVQAAPGDTGDISREDVRAGVTNFLERVYYELRNVGRTPHERAINFAATNAFEVERVYARAMGDEMELDTIDVEPSTICPPGANCWDVKLVFFFPNQPQTAIRRLHRFTVDVADVVPATIGPMRSWSIR